jgi:hydroxymethylbilane synthase
LIATSSPRRRAQLKARFPQARWTEIRGNVETRLRRIAEDPDGPEATVLAAAGLDRLGIHSWEGLVFEACDPMEIVPAVGQAAIALQTRSEDAGRFGVLTHLPTDQAVRCERLFLQAMGGGCHSATAGWFQEGFLEIFHETTGRLQLDLRGLSPCQQNEVIQSFARQIADKPTA